MKLFLSLSFAIVAGCVVSVAAPAEKLSPSQQIDALIEKGYAAHKVTPNEPSADAVLVRRLYLDIVGRIPTRAEAESYLLSKESGKSAKLISELLAGEGYVNHWFNYWADLLRVNRNANNSQFVAPHYAEFIKDFLRRNRHYDQFVRELLTTDGAVWESGAVGYYLRDRGMPLDNMSNTVRVFLGTRLECAQCHDHPFDKWTQLDYYQMAAFSYDMQSNYRPPIVQNLQSYVRGKDASRDLSRGSRQEQAGMRNVVQEVLRPLRYTAIQRQDQTLRLPDDYHYPNGKPREAVTPKTMFGDNVSPNLDAYGAWITAKENPRFTTVIANRLWKEVFGIGLIEPVDEVTDQTVAANPELMAFLSERMKALDYDLKAFLEMLYNTRTYQRQATRKEIQPGDPYHFPGPILRRMKAEQIWDSVVTLINPQPDARPENLEALAQTQLETVHKIHDSIYALKTEEFIDGIKTVAKAAATGVQRTQELTAQIAEARKAKDEARARKLSMEANQYRGDIRKQIREHIYEPGWQELVSSGKAAKTFGSAAAAGPMLGDREERMMMGMSSGRSPNSAMSDDERARYTALASEAGITDRSEIRSFAEFMRSVTTQAPRAANLPSPAPNGHFLREFGQSDRDVIENANGDASLPQALRLLNGTIGETLMSKYGVLARAIMKETTPEDRINVIYLSIYSRYPTAAEREYLAPFIARLGNDAYKDIVHAAVNTQQFLFIQ